MAAAIHAEASTTQFAKREAAGASYFPQAVGPKLYSPADAQLGIEALRSPELDARFTSLGNQQLWVGRKAPVAWLRFGLESRDALDDEPRILVVQPSFSIVMDKVDLYVPLRDSGFKRYSAGALVPPQAGELRGRYFLFPLPRDALEGGRYYLRAEASTDVEFHVFVRTQDQILRQTLLESIAYGAVFGVLGAMALYNLFLFFSLKDIAYLAYVLYIAAGSAWLFLVQGWAQALLGIHPGLDQTLLFVFAGLMQATGGIFAALFLKLRRNMPVFFAILCVLIFAGFAAAAAGALGFHRLALATTNGLGLAIGAALIVAPILRLAQGFSSARYFLVGWTLLALASLAFALMDLKVLPVNFLTSNCLALGMTAESILLSMALADRVRSLARENLKLARIQERLRESSRRDPLTGLFNRRFIEESYGVAVAEAEAARRPLSVIMLDIDGFKGVNDSWGHSFGDEVLAALGEVIRSSLREADSPCRYGGEEFLLVMPGIEIEDAACVAERIRERFAATGLVAASGETVRATVSLGVAELRRGESSKSLLDRADAALYEAKRRGKNRVEIAGAPRE
jgi:diguanylate cyclase (GGDEF) domain